MTAEPGRSPDLRATLSGFNSIALLSFVTVADKTKILLVDDEVAIRNLYQIYLESSGFSVVAAASAPEALWLLRRDRFGLALVDICLGTENGIELVKGIVQANVGLPAIIITGIAPDQALYEEALRSGAAAVFSKHRPLTELVLHIERALARSGKNATARSGAK